MTLNRLLVLRKPAIHFHKTAVPKSTRWCSSSSSSGAEKPSSSGNLEAAATAKEQRDVAEEESDNKYMERHSGSFLHPTDVQNEVGESWLTLKGIFTNLKAKMLGSPQFQKQNTVEIIDSAADKTVSEVMKTKDSPQDSEIGQPHHSYPMPKVIRDSHSCKQNISTGLRSDIVGENSSSDVLDATASNEVEVPKYLDTTGPGEPKNIIHSSAGIVCSSENLVGVTVSEVRKESVSENKSTIDALHIMQKSSLGNSAGQVASKGKSGHVGHKDVEHGINECLVQTLEPFADSHHNEKKVTETAASNIIWKRSSKDIGQSRVKPESHRQLKVGVLESDSGCLSSLTHQLPGEVYRILQKDVANGSTVVGNGNHQPGKKTLIFDLTPTAGSDVGKMHASSNGSQQVMGLANMFMKTMKDQKADEMTSKISTLASNGVLELLNETNDKTTGKEDMGNRFNINGLIGCIKELPRESSTNTSQNCTTANNTGILIKKVGSVKKVPSHTNAQESDAKRKESPIRGHAMGRETSTPRGSDNLEVGARKKSKARPTSKEDLNKTPSTSYQKDESTESKVLVRFLLKRVHERMISEAFNNCGGVVKIQLLPLIEGSNFRDAYVHFKTREGSQKALRKSNLIIEGSFVLVEATSLEDVPNKISVPNLIGDLEVPLLLVKNPTRTVMIKQLTHDISTYQLKEALAFCGSGISRFFLGSSSSVAYVEFETEDAKERAIAAYSINIQGKQLLIFRIDVPRTTVIRITNFDETVFSESMLSAKIISVCRSYGEVYSQTLRGKGILDVYFKLAEWANMLSILNRLNGMEVDGHRWIAQPAPIFPPEVLQVLWSKPDERIHVKSALRRLLQNIELPVEISNLATKYYDTSYFHIWCWIGCFNFLLAIQENMAEAVVSFVVERVGDLIIQQGRSFAGVGDQVTRAHTDLLFIKGFLKDADARRRDNEAIRIFVAKTRDVAYDLEDVIETFVLKVDSKRKGGIKSVLRRLGCIFNEGVRLHKIGSEIGVINTTISDLKSHLQTYGIIRESGGSSSSLQLHETQQQQLRRTYSHVVERNIVRLEERAYELVMRLTKEEHGHHRVISIWGMGGLGKTTLARQVYHHKEVVHHFDCFAWVSISQQCQVRDVLETIYVKLKSPTKDEREEIARLKDAELPGRLSHLQNERKCLIVLDDIWKTDTWDVLKAAFEHDEKSKSKILLTTRNVKVALHADANGFCYQPPPLNEIESWELFEKIALCGRDDAIDKEVYMKMKELGKKMLRHCSGLPLAIIVLGGLLARKNTEWEWNTINENVCVYINRGIGRLEEEHASASWVLALSYDDLPYYLKQCFLYLGHFPEDHEIHVKSLIKLWIAEGFISLTQRRQGLGETMEDVAYNWLSELVERCMVQVGEHSLTFGTFKSCRMHDLMRDLCLVKAEEEKFLQVVKFSHKNEAMHHISSSNISNASPMGKIRRLAIYLDENDDEVVPSRDEIGRHLRSLLYFGPNDFRWFSKRELIIPSMFKDFKLLRVLKIEGVQLPEEEEVELPSAIGNMVHLRFLSLRRSGIKSFPRFLGNLICLQTLDFRVDNREMVIPNVIWKMNRLRHLHLPSRYRARGKLQLSSLGDLKTLDSIWSGCCDLNDVAKLRNLRKLGIRLQSRPWKNLEKMLEAAGSVLKGIRSLELWNRLERGGEEDMQQIVARCGQIYKLRLDGPTLELPKEFHSYSNLTKVFLFNCGLKDDQMAKLEKLPNLKSLVLAGDVLGENTNILVFSNGSFPRLLFLGLHLLLGIREWRVEEGAMSSLCRLLISGCSGLSRVPDGVRHLTTLKELTIEWMPREFCSKVEQGGEDFHQIQHVPSLLIRNPIDKK